MKYIASFFLLALVCASCTPGVQNDTANNNTGCEPGSTEASCIFDENSDFVGLSVQEAQKLATFKEVPFRVVQEDGVSLPATMDYRPGRINASVDDGIVTSYQVEGEGMPKYDQNSWQDIIPETCMSFFDGCNNCTRSGEGDVAACTRKFCQQYEEPVCLDEMDMGSETDLQLEYGVMLYDFSQRQLIESPLVLSGVAPRNWFFEGVIPITILTLEGDVVKEWYGTGAWLEPAEGKTELDADDPIEFSATIDFVPPVDGDMGKIRIAQDPTGSQETGIEPNMVETIILWP